MSDGSVSTDSQRAASGKEANSRESCIPHFDALWFCYTPGYQLRQYYRYGNVSDCREFWDAFYNCLKKRTAFADQVPDAPKHKPLWKLRTKEEAQEAWDREFGHLRTEGGQARAEAENRPHLGFVASHNNYQSPAFAKAAQALAGQPPTPEQCRLRPTIDPGGGSADC
ncbi:g2086 [Coccomyxa elongata]